MSVVISGGQTVGLAAPGIDLRESIADAMHSIEDFAWRPLTIDPQSYQVGQDFGEPQRFQMLWRMRTLARRNPTAKWIARLGSNFTFGTGITVKAADPRWVQPVLDEHMGNRRNRQVLYSLEAQTGRYIDQFRDGDLFLVAFVDEATGAVEWRRLDAMFVGDIITDPDDVLVPRWYKVRKAASDYNFVAGNYDPRGMGNEFVYLRDIDYEPAPGDPAPPANLVRPGLVLHRAINKEAKFGLSEFYASEDWINAHRTFMEDRASLLRAWSTIAWKVTRKDSPGGVQAFQRMMQSTYASGPLLAYERNPNPAAGATLVQNEGSSREPMQIDTGGAQAVQDGDMLLQMGAIGAGVFRHYLGSPDAHRLATASAMELPALKNYEWWQRFWGDTYALIFGFVIDCAIRAGRIPGDAGRTLPSGYLATDVAPVLDEDGQPTDAIAPISRDVTVEFPPIIVPDLQAVVQGVASLANSVLPVNLGSRRRLARIAFAALQVDDIDAAVAECFPAGEGDDVLLPGQGITKPLGELQQAQQDAGKGDDGDTGDDNERQSA